MPNETMNTSDMSPISLRGRMTRVTSTGADDHGSGGSPGTQGIKKTLGLASRTRGLLDTSDGATGAES
jgi:hypothetical protein